jgi:hypothetical protein
MSVRAVETDCWKLFNFGQRLRPWRWLKKRGVSPADVRTVRRLIQDEFLGEEFGNTS